MSKLKINPDLFLGSQELNRFKKFLDDDGFRKLLLQDSMSFGVVNNSKDGEFNNFRVELGTNAGTIKHADGIAIDKYGNMITKVATDNVTVPNDNAWYWLKIKHQYSTVEIGTVSIDINGNLTGVDTAFLDVLRGQPNIASRVKFSGSTLNTAEYDVVEVISDTSAILSGDFLAESNLKLIVIGSFTPDTVTPSGSKEIFQYDSCLMTFVPETVPSAEPTKTEDEEFFIARVKRNGSVIDIHDKRYDVFKSKADFYSSRIAAATNPLIGVENIMFDSIKSTRHQNVVQVAWGFRSSNWTIDPSTNRLTLIAGEGGKFKDTTYFTDGDFDGWRVYTLGSSAYSTYAVVKTSTKAGTQINLILDTLDPINYANGTQQVVVVPDCDTVDFRFTPVDDQEMTYKDVSFPVNLPFAKVHLTLYTDTTCDYNVKYRYSTFGDYRAFTVIPNDTVSGYLKEECFDSDGIQTSTVRQTYSSGNITLVVPSNAYNLRIGSVETGDIFGVEYRELMNISPVIELQVGLAKQNQYFRTVDILDGGQGTPYTLTVAHYISLKTTSLIAIKAGNSFTLKFIGDYVPGAFNINIVQDYVNPGSPGTPLYTFTTTDFDEARTRGFFLQFIFDGTDWLVKRFSADSGILGTFTHDLNSVSLSGEYYALATSANLPTDASEGFLHMRVKDSNTAVQTFISHNLDRTWMRRKLSGAWNAWVEIATTVSSVLPSRTLIAGSGLSGGGDLSANRTFDVNVDNATVEISADAIQVKDGGLLGVKFGTNAVSDHLGYVPVAPSRQVIAGNGLTGGGDFSSDKTLNVNVDNSTIELSGDALRVKAAGIGSTQLGTGITPGTWINITLDNGWAAYFTETPQYMVDRFGAVHLRGQVDGAAATSSTISTSGFLPNPNVVASAQFATVKGDGSGYNRVIISTTGTLQLNIADYSVGERVRLEGIVYWP